MNTTQQRIIDVLHLKGVLPKKQDEIISRVESLIQETIQLEIIKNLSPDELKKLSEFDTTSTEAISKFLEETIPNFNKYVRDISVSVVNSIVE